MKYQFYYKEKKDGSLCLMKVYGQYGMVEIPETINGKQVSEIGPYCFSYSKVEDSFFYTESIDGIELSCDEIEEVYLPRSIQKINSYAFYNCRNLKKLKIYEIKELGSDVFMNCLSLHTIQMDSFSHLKNILKQISWNIVIQTPSFSLFFPEYYEIYDEIGPAHIFGIHIEGEGYRMRQCFQTNRFLFEEYDKCFDKLKNEEKEEIVCQVAYYRLYYPYQLNDKEVYEQYIMKHLKPFSELLNIENIFYFEKYLNVETIDSLIQKGIESENPLFVTKCMELKRKKFKKRTYDFEDFI